MLVRHFTKKYALKMGREIDKIPSDTMRALVSWQWPGNVRELENFIERSVILSNGSTLHAPIDELKPEAMEMAAATRSRTWSGSIFSRCFEIAAGSLRRPRRGSVCSGPH